MLTLLTLALYILSNSEVGAPSGISTDSPLYGKSSLEASILSVSLLHTDLTLAKPDPASACLIDIQKEVRIINANSITGRTLDLRITRPIFTFLLNLYYHRYGSNPKFLQSENS